VDPVGPDDHVAGPADAPLTIVEYGDYQCPYCGEAYPIVRDLQSTFRGKLRFVFRNFPLTNVHPYALGAAEAAEAVALQGHFWPMYDLLYEHQYELEEEALLSYAEQAGADPAKVARAVRRGTTRARVDADLETGVRSGVIGTPTFFINEHRYDGAWDYTNFERFLKGILERGQR
jgi:protein-disulfide isomerase